ncbi:LamB/YcsF family protein [Comamonas humi]
MALSINCDVGEAFGIYRCGDDEGVMPFIDLANVACGFHASDPLVMWRTVALAQRHSVQIGAHPSYPDLQGFGRRAMEMAPEELTACIMYQVGALKAFLDEQGIPLNHIKPHGALYGTAATTAPVARSIARVAAMYGVPFMGLAGTEHEVACNELGIGFIAEFFADREYADDGSLIITRRSHEVDVAEAAQRVVRAVREGKVRSVNGHDVVIRADTVCVHSETPRALELARAIDQALDFCT